MTSLKPNAAKYRNISTRFGVLTVDAFELDDDTVKVRLSTVTATVAGPYLLALELELLPDGDSLGRRRAGWTRESTPARAINNDELSSCLRSIYDWCVDGALQPDSDDARFALRQLKRAQLWACASDD